MGHGHRPFMRAEVRPYLLAAAKEQALKPMDTFRECAPRICPEMVVVPAGIVHDGFAADRDRGATTMKTHSIM